MDFFTQEDNPIHALKFGLKFHPPCIYLTYLDGSKKRRRAMPVRGLTENSNPSQIASFLAKKHPIQLGPSVVSKAQLQGLVQKLINNLQETRERDNNNRDRDVSTPINSSSPIAINKPIIPSLKLTAPNTTIPLKNLVSTAVEEITTTTKPSSSTQNKLSLLDDGDDDLINEYLQDDFEDDFEDDYKTEPTQKTNNKNTMTVVSNDNKSDDNDDDGDESYIEDEYEDLNKLDDASLARRKSEMNVAFEKNRLRPGDKGFVYDKRMEFSTPSQPSEWDEGLEEDDDDF